MTMNVVVGIWKTWTTVEKKTPPEMKDAQFIRVSAGFAGLGLEGFTAFQNDGKYFARKASERTENYRFGWIPLDRTMRNPRKKNFFLVSLNVGEVGDEEEEILVFPSLSAIMKKVSDSEDSINGITQIL